MSACSRARISKTARPSQLAWGVGTSALASLGLGKGGISRLGIVLRVGPGDKGLVGFALGLGIPLGISGMACPPGVGAGQLHADGTLLPALGLLPARIRGRGNRHPSAARLGSGRELVRTRAGAP